MRAHVIDDGIVVNTIEVESLNFIQGLIDASLGGKIGDLWDGVSFTTPDPVIQVPASVTMRQAHRALNNVGLLSLVDAAIDAISDPEEKMTAYIDWNKSNEVHRDWPSVASIGTAIGLTSEQIDDLFIAAAAL